MSEFRRLAREDTDSTGEASTPAVAPYKATRLAVRVAIPQLALLLCLSLLGHVCYEASIPEVEHKSKIHLTVGPGCIAGPKPEKLKFNAIDNVTCAAREEMTTEEAAAFRARCETDPLLSKTLVRA